MMKINGCTQRGQTLVETIVAILFISISVVALIRFQNYLAYDNSIAHQKDDAMILAIKQIETLKEFQVLNNTTGYSSYQSIATGSSSATVTNTTYTITWTVTQYTNPTYKNIDVTITWTDRYNTVQSVRLISNVAGVDPANATAII